MRTFGQWPAGRTWVFQGTVLEDATAGTHAATLTVTPGAGNEMELLFGTVTVGATATSQNVSVLIDDGANQITALIDSNTTTSTLQFRFPVAAINAGTGNQASISASGARYVVSGTMRAKLQVSTTAVSVTQTFAVVARLLGGLPTATLADSVGAPTLTTNTNKVF